MADLLEVRRAEGMTIQAVGSTVTVGYGQAGADISAADLLWLVTTGGPAMIALLGGPLAIKGGNDGR